MFKHPNYCGVCGFPLDPRDGNCYNCDTDELGTVGQDVGASALCGAFVEEEYDDDETG